ncbi:diaminopimelate epimerase [Gulosibacter chungangensis]|uniref:Diaminopimelate epimerase n=1 Tax=Gulosibacter chungangensis TaxID=979746 RepID=A0A7J5B906_9MICO|nr:diaminopimelate epimerase [Gulosibacter chungangensis]KAB1641868.1 diaminopimelate epimerase [Gulosibacter chungangensis]
MPPIQFTKIHTLGNDFLVVVDPSNSSELTAEEVRALCDRHQGIGADGVIRAVRSDSVPEGARVLAEVPEAEWFMDYITARGVTEGYSANGLRAMARVLTESNLVDLPKGETLSIGTRVGVMDVQRNSTDGFQADLGRWRLVGGEPLVQAGGLRVARPGLGIEVGIPFVVVALSSEEELAELDLRDAPLIEPTHPAGLSVAFVVPEEPLVKNGVGQLRVRTYERDLGETRSSGTAAAAVALAVRHWAGEGAPHHWRVSAVGGAMQVRMFPTEEGEHLGQAGPAEIVFSGAIELDQTVAAR